MRGAIEGVYGAIEDQIGARSAPEAGRVMPVTPDAGEHDPRRARERGAREHQALRRMVARIRVDYGPAASAGAPRADAHEEAPELGGRVAGRSTRSSLSAPPQCEQRMGLGAGASLSGLSGGAANPCAISTRALTSSKGTLKEGERKP